jgi:hypothetical protein
MEDVKRKVGRPKKVGPKQDRREVFMTTEAESKALRVVAARLDVPVGEAIRRAVKDFVRRQGR